MGAATSGPGQPLGGPVEPAIRERGVGLNSTVVLVISLVIQFIGYVATIFYAKAIGGTEQGLALIGIVSFYLLIATSINWLGDLRIQSAFIYFVSRGQPPEKSTGTYLGVRLLLVLAVGLSSIPVVLALHRITSPAELQSYSVFALLPLLWTPGLLYNLIHTARGDSAKGQFPLLIEGIVRTIGLVSVLFFFTPSIASMTFAYLVAAIASAGFSLRYVGRFVRRPDLAEARRLFRYAWPLMASLMLQYLAVNLPPFLVQALYNNVQLANAELAYFLAANGFRILLLAVPAALMVPLFPHLASLHAKGDHELLRSRTWKALRYTALVVVPGIVFLLVYRVTVLNVFYRGNYAYNAQFTLAILAVSALPLALSQVIGTALNAIGQQRLELYISGVQVASMFAVTGVLLFAPSPPYLAGITGVGVAVLASSIAALALNTYFMERLLAVRIQLRSFGTIAASAAAGFFTVSRLNAFIPVNRYYSLAAAVVLGFTAYFLVLAATGELSKEDVRTIVKALGLPERVGRPLERICWKEREPEDVALLKGGLVTGRGAEPIPGVSPPTGGAEPPATDPGP